MHIHGQLGSEVTAHEEKKERGRTNERTNERKEERHRRKIEGKKRESGSKRQEEGFFVRIGSEVGAAEWG